MLRKCLFALLFLSKISTTLASVDEEVTVPAGSFICSKTLTLPRDIGIQVFSHLEKLVELYQAERVCNAWQQIIRKEESLWRPYLAKYYPLSLLHYSGEDMTPQKMMRHLVAAQPFFTDLGTLQGYERIRATAMSCDGKTVAVQVFNTKKGRKACLYTADDGLQIIKALEGYYQSRITALSYDGTYGVGNLKKNKEAGVTAFIYSIKDGVTYLETNDVETYAWAVSADGRRIGGAAKAPDKNNISHIRSAVWFNDGKAIKSFDKIDIKDINTCLVGMCAKGQVTVEHAEANDDNSLKYLALYKKNKKTYEYSPDPDFGGVIISSVSADGTCIVGYEKESNSEKPNCRAVYWDDKLTYSELTFKFSFNPICFDRVCTGARGVNANGKVILGDLRCFWRNICGPSNAKICLFYRNPKTQVFDKKLNLSYFAPDNWKGKKAKAISWDGITVLICGDKKFTVSCHRSALVTIPRFDILIEEGFIKLFPTKGLTKHDQS